MMGRKTRAEVRQQLLEALEAAGKDPIAWLEKHVAVTRKDDVLQALKRFLERNRKKKPRGQKAASKSRRGQ